MVVVSVWAYQPRANDGFELERGDMVKVVGLWGRLGYRSEVG